jgi:hypothetical protein
MKTETQISKVDCGGTIFSIVQNKKKFSFVIEFSETELQLINTIDINLKIPNGSKLITDYETLDDCLLDIEHILSINQNNNDAKFFNFLIYEIKRFQEKEL